MAKLYGLLLTLTVLSFLAILSLSFFLDLRHYDYSNRKRIPDETDAATAPANHSLPTESSISVPNSLWYNISNHTLIWSVAHYEDRNFSYGGPAIIVMMFHYHLVDLPELYLYISEQCIGVHRWVEFGKLVEVKYEVDFGYYAVFRLTSELQLPHSVLLSVNSDCTTFITNEMSLYYTSDSKMMEFAICLHQGLVTNDNQEKLLNIASWIELNRELGVGHVTIYNQDISSKVYELLKSYEEDGFVSIVEWKLNNPEKRIGVNGQVMVINDCFYRHLRNAKYILFIDVDELIVPHNASTLSEMMKQIDDPKITQYRFYNSFWHDVGNFVNGTNYTFDSSSRSLVPVHFRRTWRTINCPITIRHKNIVKVETAIQVGIHHVYNMKRGQKRLQVSEKFGLMHHYRIPDYAFMEDKMEDLTMSRYTDKVMLRLKHTPYIRKNIHVNGMFR